KIIQKKIPENSVKKISKKKILLAKLSKREKNSILSLLSSLLKEKLKTEKYLKLETKKKKRSRKVF
ncbi:hypothetical protein DOY81_003772, partial [Sarcophaga bullata]